MAVTEFIFRFSNTTDGDKRGGGALKRMNPNR